MPLSLQERLKKARQTVVKHYPKLSEADTQRICDIAASGFDGNYSPIKKEQNSRRAIGQGASFRDFTIAIGRNIANRNPQFVTEKELGEIIKKVWTF